MLLEVNGSCASAKLVIGFVPDRVVFAEESVRGSVTIRRLVLSILADCVCLLLGTEREDMLKAAVKEGIKSLTRREQGRKVGREGR